MDNYLNNNPSGNSSAESFTENPVNRPVNPQQNQGAYNQGQIPQSPANAPYQPYYPQQQSPVDVYNNTPKGNSPQYHYGVPTGFMDSRYIEEQHQKYLLRRNHEKALKQLGNRAGIALLLLLVLSYSFSMFIAIPRISALYLNNLSFSCAFAVFYTVVTVGGAFFLAYKAFNSAKNKPVVNYSKPKDSSKAFLLILIGFAGCIAANFVTSVLRGVAESFGIYSSYSAIEDPSNLFDIILMFISTAIIPPLIEEFAARGVLLHSLKKYGNSFAILGSAFVFSVLHGNAVQMPFAFICALFIGYAVIATDSIWTGIIIHALVNSMSCISSALMYYFDEPTANMYFYIASGAGFILGIIALFVYTNRYRDENILKIYGEAPDLPLKTKFKGFVTSPVMIIGVILFLLQAITTLTTTPTTY